MAFAPFQQQGKIILLKSHIDLSFKIKFTGIFRLIRGSFGKIDQCSGKKPTSIL